jgi:outer membrane protein assembly factor BamB
MKRHLLFPFAVGDRPTWNPHLRLAFSFAIAISLLLVNAGSLRAYTSVRVALHSNILVDGKRAIFAQGTGSLTVLNLETGEVLLRKKPGRWFEYSGKLQRSPHGVLMMSYDRIALLDGSTFEPVWRADHCQKAVSDGEYVVSHDGEHTVTCRMVQTGQVYWKIDMEGGWHLFAASGKVLVATPDAWDKRSALLILDVRSGRQILRHEAAPEDHWQQVYFDGQLIYLVEGNSIYKEKSYPRRPIRVKMLDLEGKAVSSVDYKSPDVVSNSAQEEEAPFIWGDKYFSDGRVQPVSLHQRTSLAALWKKGDEWRNMLENDEEYFGRRDRFGRIDCGPQLLPSGIFANFPSKDKNNEIGQLLRMSNSQGTWTAFAPHLGKFGLISHVAEADGKLLLGSSEGQVECLDIGTGRPRWLYSFPVIRETVTYSAPHGMPPYLTQQEAEFRDELKKTSISCGSITLTSDYQQSAKWEKLRAETEYSGHIVIDPSPDDPFAELGTYTTWLAVCASLPIAGGLVLLAIHLARRRSLTKAPPETSRDKMPASTGLVAWFLMFSIAPAYGLLAYGRVSYSWTLALKVIFAMTIIAAVIGAVRLCYARRWLAAVAFSAMLIGWVFLMWGPLRFA